MTVDKHDVVAILRPLDIEVKVKRAVITLDETLVPYGRADLTCVLPDEATRALIDLREQDLRVDLRPRRDFGRPWSIADLTALGGGSIATLTTLLNGGPIGNLTNRLYKPWNGALILPAQSRDFDLMLLERVFDDRSKEMTLIATTDEAKLINGALVEAAFWDPGTTDVAEITSLVLARYDLELDPTSETATVEQEDATVQRPGVSDYDYLRALLEPAGLRLWCDERRRFRIDARPAVAPGTVALSVDGPLTGHRDRMSFDPAVWADAVVVHYTWTDEEGVAHEAWDVAGEMPATSVLVLERPDTVYPGPGLAASRLSILQGRGRVLEVQHVSRYSVTPGQAATISPPETPTQTGYVQAVRWRYPESEMDVDTRGLVDTPESAWALIPEGEAWDDSPADESWADETIGA